MWPHRKNKPLVRKFFLDGRRSDGQVLRRVDATGWTDAQVRTQVLAMLLTMDIDSVREVVEYRIEEA